MDYAGVEALATKWREDANLLRRRGAPRQAEALESAADDLQQRLREWATEPLTVAEAAQESGYSERRLRELLSEGRLANAGRSGAPRIRRQDLPAKPGSSGPTLKVADGGMSLAEEALEKRRP